MKFLCPVCGYDQLSRPPKNYHICPCCGTEFGHDDLEASHETLRREWIGRGMGWFSCRALPSAGWSPMAQLLKVGHGYGVSSAQQTKASSICIVTGSQVAAWTTEPIRVSLRPGPAQTDRSAGGSVPLRPCLP